jgi:hypoxanthine phosphoribosyltransferase
MARSLADRLSGLEADALVYVRDGGRAPGRALADALGLPAIGLDVRYPLSRALDSTSGWLRIPLLAVKELTYRLTAPRPGNGSTDALPPAGSRVILFDDSASSGRTVAAALQILSAAGIPRERVCVTVLRCGPRARGLVDCFAIGRRVTFSR